MCVHCRTVSLSGALQLQDTVYCTVLLFDSFPHKITDDLISLPSNHALNLQSLKKKETSGNPTRRTLSSLPCFLLGWSRNSSFRDEQVTFCADQMEMFLIFLQYFSIKNESRCSNVAVASQVSWWNDCARFVSGLLTTIF